VRKERVAIGTGLTAFASRGVPWTIEAADFDCCMIGHEHRAFDFETIAYPAGRFQATDVSAIAWEASAGQANAQLRSVGIPTP
jgi:hypothetical protein